VLWTAARKRNCLIDDMAKWLCERPALLPGLTTKGKIEKGYDADLVVWNPEQSFSVKEDIIRHKHKITPYLGEELFGLVEQTWLGGVKVFDKGKNIESNKGDVILKNKGHKG
jgi:allantoinase